ncbi:IS110 family transposase, partial [Gordonia sp. HY002]|nr:IS110 family transposase [Gordonia zhenghanii]
MPSVAETHSYVIGVDTHARNHVYAIVHAQTGAQVGQPR